MVNDEHAIRYTAGGGWIVATHPALPPDLVGYGHTEHDARSQLLAAIEIRAGNLAQQAALLNAMRRTLAVKEEVLSEHA